MKSTIAALIIASVATACDNEWWYEECSDMEWRELCEGECDNDGWMYWDEWLEDEFCVSKDDFADWEMCW